MTDECDARSGLKYLGKQHANLPKGMTKFRCRSVPLGRIQAVAKSKSTEKHGQGWAGYSVRNVQIGLENSQIRVKCVRCAIHNLLNCLFLRYLAFRHPSSGPRGRRFESCQPDCS
jgi:hypothetical protein